MYRTREAANRSSYRRQSFGIGFRPEMRPWMCDAGQEEENAAGPTKHEYEKRFEQVMIRLTITVAPSGKLLGRKRLADIGAFFTPDTILRWHRQLLANKSDYSDRRKNRVGRSRVRQVIVDLTLRMAKENPSWDCDRIQGGLASVGNRISDTTGENIPHPSERPQAPRTPLSWSMPSILDLEELSNFGAQFR